MVPSPGSTGLMSDADHVSSPTREDRSFAHRSATEEDTQSQDHGRDTSERPSGRGKSRASQPNQLANSNIGKIRHLKKEDGEPLWRKDIQYDFLRAIFDNEQKVFTNSYDPGAERQCFADLYIDAMARSSKTSKILRDKLLSDRDAAKGMAMVCLLVNIGRMNTTLNFFPEMRAQLRTYHAIPSLQARQDPHAYKQLQDAPRLKSILKGGAEDRAEPNTLDKIKIADVPRTNPVNLIFVICNSAAKIAELHFPPGSEFHHLVMKTCYTSESRARAFLWIMWFYLESDFTEEGCEENPFGPGIDYGVDVANQGVPVLQEMTEEEEAQENVDTQEEIEFGKQRQKMRAKIIEADQDLARRDKEKVGRGRHSAVAEEGSVSATALPRIRPVGRHESDRESSRSTPPPRALGRSILGGSARRGVGLKVMYEGSSPAGPGPHVIEGIVARKPRPPTAHQLAVERNRNQRVEYILDRGLRKKFRARLKYRKREGAVIRAVKRVEHMQNPFEDSEDEEFKVPGADKGQFREKGYGGLVQTVDEDDDFGEEVSAYGAALRRATRRLDRWLEYEDELGVVAPIKRIKAAGLSEEHDSGEGGLLGGESPDKRDVSIGVETSSFHIESAKAVKVTNGHLNGDSHIADEDCIDDLRNQRDASVSTSAVVAPDQSIVTTADADTDMEL